MALTQVSTGGIKDGQVHTADLADAQITAGKLHADALDHTYTLGADGSNHYTFTGEGLTGAVNDPTLYLTRGKTYRFVNGNSSGAHPFRIQTTVNGSAGTEYNTGVTNNGGAGGSTIVFEVPHAAPDVLYYQCTSHGSMGGILYVTGALADGSVTTAKLADANVTTAKIADDAVDADKIADSINTAIAANTAKTTNATHTGEVTGDTALTIADNVVDEANLKVSNSPTNGYMLTAQSGNTGGLTWAEAGGGKIIQTYVIKSTSDITNSNPSTGVYYPLETASITVSAGTTLHIFANYHYWIQANSHIIYGTQGLQAEVGGSGSWSTIRDPGGYESYSVATVNSGGGTPGDNINQIGDIASLNTYWTHGQSAGSTVKIRIYHNHQYASNCIFMNFGRYGTERNIIVYEVSP